MEEQKKEKVVKMTPSATDKGMKKLTYEQLNDACNQLYQQNRQLSARNKELEQFIMAKRLDYLFKVLEFSEKFTKGFVQDCATEIEEGMRLPQSTDTEKAKEA